MSESEDKFPSITPDTHKEKEALIEFIPLAEMVARKELGSMPGHLADFRELVNLGLIKINDLIKEAHEKDKTYNPSYVIQGIIWAIRNRNRKDSTQRGEFKSSVFGKHNTNNEDKSFSIKELQEAIIETVVSIDDDNFELADNKAIDPGEQAAVSEMHQAIRDSIAVLPDNYREVVQLRFYKGMKGVDIAKKLGVSSARVTRIIQDAIEQMKERMQEKKLL